MVDATRASGPYVVSLYGSTPPSPGEIRASSSRGCDAGLVTVRVVGVMRGRVLLHAAYDLARLVDGSQQTSGGVVVVGGDRAGRVGDGEDTPGVVVGVAGDATVWGTVGVRRAARIVGRERVAAGPASAIRVRAGSPRRSHTSLSACPSYVWLVVLADSLCQHTPGGVVGERRDNTVWISLGRDDAIHDRVRRRRTRWIRHAARHAVGGKVVGVDVVALAIDELVDDPAVGVVLVRRVRAGSTVHCSTSGRAPASRLRVTRHTVRAVVGEAVLPAEPRRRGHQVTKGVVPAVAERLGRGVSGASGGVRQVVFDLDHLLVVVGCLPVIGRLTR